MVAQESPNVRIIWEHDQLSSELIDIKAFLEQHKPHAKWDGLIEDQEDFATVRLDANGEAITWGYGRVIPASMLKTFMEGNK